MRSPDCGYSSSASSRYMSCSTSKSFASEAAQWRLSATRISFSSILLFPFLVRIEHHGGSSDLFGRSPGSRKAPLDPADHLGDFLRRAWPWLGPPRSGIV